MRKLRRLVAITLLLLLGSGSAGGAATVTLEASAPLPDHSDAAIEAALKGALETCVRGATALGLRWIALEDALVLGDRVVVRMIAGDEEEEDRAGPSRGAPRPQPGLTPAAL